MTSAWRITKAKYAEDAFSGEGARRAGGRFNSPGHAAVYASSSLALAELEILVNLPTDRLLGSYIAFQIQIPEAEIESRSPEDLPAGWRSDPAPRPVKDIGDRWLASGRGLALKVPSAVVPRESNYLLRPKGHPGFDRLNIEGPFDPDVDPRLQ